MLRGAIYRAARDAGSEGLRDENISQRVTAALSLPFESYAADPSIRFGRDAVEKALRGVIGYRLYRDLRRGWRISAPNLEQCGLLEIDYAELDALAAADDIWLALHPVLGKASADTRKLICKTLLDFLRRELCIEVDYLQPDFQDTLKRNSRNQLRDPWAFDEGENLRTPENSLPMREIGGRTRAGYRFRLPPFRLRPVPALRLHFPQSTPHRRANHGSGDSGPIRRVAPGKYSPGMPSHRRVRPRARIPDQLRLSDLAGRKRHGSPTTTGFACQTPRPRAVPPIPSS